MSARALLVGFSSSSPRPARLTRPIPRALVSRRTSARVLPVGFLLLPSASETYPSDDMSLGLPSDVVRVFLAGRPKLLLSASRRGPTRLTS
ncbi:hypothetical protein QQF64_019734 [Cirrhinus molitorella]|uniref:Uncharacterized protein n=1 Tax=Cirrhinus molitorella TaxID=172907 RepID=A0ABR3LGA8_9TELE